jgi:hypothetical protein
VKISTWWSCDLELYLLRQAVNLSLKLPVLRIGTPCDPSWPSQCLESGLKQSGSRGSSESGLGQNLAGRGRNGKTRPDYPNRIFIRTMLHRFRLCWANFQDDNFSHLLSQYLDQHGKLSLGGQQRRMLYRQSYLFDIDYRLPLLGLERGPSRFCLDRLHSFNGR